MTTDEAEIIRSQILYAGYQYDKESKYYNLHARYYDPQTARFLQQDTYWGEAGDPLSLNLYTYCHNEPIMYVDPTGYAEKTAANLLVDIMGQKNIYEEEQNWRDGLWRTDRRRYFRTSKQKAAAKAAATYREAIFETDTYKNNSQFKDAYDKYYELHKDDGGTMADVIDLIAIINNSKEIGPSYPEIYNGESKNNSSNSPSKVTGNNATTVSDNGLNYIANMEVGKRDLVLDANGNILQIKPTVNNTTIGYGYDLTQDPLNTGIKKATNISQATALKYLKGVANIYANKITTSKDITISLNQQQLDALVALRYNVGALGEVPNLLNDINNNASYSTMQNHIYVFYDDIVKADPSKAQYLQGWKNRADTILNTYFYGNYGSMPINAVKGVYK
ncbi:MAG: tRNA(Glu)-specific nuclease WapA precursor [Firmicutes bacterium ADurb.Bin419]|nr:MAG: tRNA(Glu)-specific nuclease WapA precursor [Firmicutes bacterium ADurb.Bin419]